MLVTKSTLQLVYVLRAIKYRIQAFMANLDYFRTRFCTTLAKNYFNKRTKLEAVRALTYSLTQNCWDTFVSPCPLKVCVQDLVTEPQ